MHFLIFYALLLLGVVLLALTICLMAFYLPWWSVGSGIVTVAVWWLISKFKEDFDPEDEE